MNEEYCKQLENENIAYRALAQNLADELKDNARHTFLMHKYKAYKELLVKYMSYVKGITGYDFISDVPYDGSHHSINNTEWEELKNLAKEIN